MDLYRRPLFLDCLAEASDETLIATPVLAANCIAHETAHLLLSNSAHAAMGIMRARPDRLDWERAAHGGLTFSTSQAAQMRHTLQRRLTAEVSSARR